MKNTRKILVALVLILTMLLGMTAITAFAEETNEEKANSTTIYFKPDSQWPNDNAWFAAYCWRNATAESEKIEGWYKLTDTDSDGYYEAEVSTDYVNVIICRMDPAKTDLAWESSWNQTEDLSIPTDGKNCFTINDPWAGNGKGAKGSWSALNGDDDTTGDDTTTPGGDDTTGDDTTTPETSGNFYVVAGSENLTGANWDVASTANKMTLDENGIYTKTFEDVPVGIHEFKVAVNGAWTESYPAQNYSLNLDAISDVTITFNAETKAVNVNAVPTGEASGPVQYTYTVAGDSGLCGSNWDTKATANDMTLNSEGTLYVKTFTNVAAGSYGFKIVLNHDWAGAVGGEATDANKDGNYLITLEAASDVTISFNATTKEISVSITGAEQGGDNTGSTTPTASDYYLVGFINGADIGIADDSANFGDYKFVNGKVTVKFTEDSYVVVKDSTGKQYWAAAYCTDKSVDLADGNSEKMFVAKDVEVTFTLVVNDDGTVTLSYTEASESAPEDSKPDTNKPDTNKPEDNKEPEVELNFFQKIWKAVTDFFANIGAWFKNLFSKK